MGKHLQAECEYCSQLANGFGSFVCQCRVLRLLGRLPPSAPGQEHRAHEPALAIAYRMNGCFTGQGGLKALVQQGWRNIIQADPPALPGLQRRQEGGPIADRLVARQQTAWARRMPGEAADQAVVGAGGFVPQLFYDGEISP